MMAGVSRSFSSLVTIGCRTEYERTRVGSLVMKQLRLEETSESEDHSMGGGLNSQMRGAIAGVDSATEAGSIVEQV